MDKPVKATVTYSQQVVSSPFPPAEELRKYHEINPELAVQLISLSKAEMEHRHKQENKVVDTQITLNKRGQWLSFISNLAILGAGLTATYFISNVIPSISNALIVALLYYLNRNRKDKEEQKQVTQ